MHAGDGGHDGQAQAVMLAVFAAARAVDAEEAVEQPRQVVGRNRLAAVLHHQLHLLRLRRRGDGDHHRAAPLGKAGGVAQQVGQRALDQRFIDRQRGIALDAQRQAGVFQRGFVKFAHLRRQVGQADRRAAPRRHAAVGLRQEQHVVDQGRQALHLLQVALQRLAQRLGAALT